MYQTLATDSSGNIYERHINPAKNKVEMLTGPSMPETDRNWIEIHVEWLKQVRSGLSCRLEYQVLYVSRRFDSFQVNYMKISTINKTTPYGIGKPSTAWYNAQTYSLSR